MQYATVDAFTAVIQLTVCCYDNRSGV